MTLLGQDGHRRERFWTANVRAVWRDDTLPDPIGAAAMATASAMEIQLQVDPETYSAQFIVSAFRIGLACELALARLTEVIDAAGLPDWESVSFHLDEVLPPQTGDHPDPAAEIDVRMIDQFTPVPFPPD